MISLRLKKNSLKVRRAELITLRDNNLILEFKNPRGSILWEMSSRSGAPALSSYDEKSTAILRLLITKRLLRIHVSHGAKKPLVLVPHDSKLVPLLVKKKTVKGSRMPFSSCLFATETGWTLTSVMASAHAEDFPFDLATLMVQHKTLPGNDPRVSVLHCAGFFRKLPPEARSWEFHDLLFHKNSSVGEATGRTGATFRGRHVGPLPPVFKKSQGKAIDLASSDEATSFQRLLGKRKTQRDFSEGPLGWDDLSSFLHRLGRVRKIEKTKHGEFAWKDYPSGGALSEEEFYVLALNCQRLVPGLYHFRQTDKKLVRVTGSTDTFQSFLAGIPEAVLKNKPQAIIVCTAKIARRYWKYEGIAFRNSLLNGGVILDQMYLHATDLNLKICAIGGVHQTSFAELIGESAFTEPVTAMAALGV